MHYTLLQFLLLLTAVVMLIMTAQRLKIAYPIFLVLAGLLISVIPHIPVIAIDPDLIFLIFLPPLLFESAWYTSWNDFWKFRRPISLLSFGLVLFTSCIIALLSSVFIPGFTLSMGFLLGGIISPPDAIAATSVLKNVKIPRRIVTILKGESLVNDASSLIVLRFALAAVLTGKFSFHEALGSFIIVGVMGILIGLAVANVMYAIHRYLPTTANIDAVLTLISPYFMYLAAEQFHYSGVLAVVSGGLFLSYRSYNIFIDGQSRLQVMGVWSTLNIILNGLVFILIGLELPEIIRGMGNYSMSMAIRYSLVVSAVVMAIRMIWIFPATFIPRWLFRRIRLSEPNPGWKGSFIIGWAGMRGVVSLAAALSIPMMGSGNKPFPHRDLIIFITFVVILVTLVFQGFTLPFLVKGLKIKEIDPIIPDDQQLANIQLRLTKLSLEILLKKYAAECNSNLLVRGYKKELEQIMTHATEYLRCISCGESGKIEVDQYKRILQDLYHAQRKELYHLRREKAFNDELIRKEGKVIDLNESKILEM